MYNFQNTQKINSTLLKPGMEIVFGPTWSTKIKNISKTSNDYNTYYNVFLEDGSVVEYSCTEDVRIAK